GARCRQSRWAVATSPWRLPRRRRDRHYRASLPGRGAIERCWAWMFFRAARVADEQSVIRQLRRAKRARCGFGRVNCVGFAMYEKADMPARRMRATSGREAAARRCRLSNERAGRTAARKPRLAGSGRLKCSMRAVQSYPCRQPALRMLSDRSPANAAFVAWCAFELILSKREVNETTGPGHPGFRVLGTRQQILSFFV